jgi:hypothetical protein
MRLPVRFRVAAPPPRLSAGLLRLGILSLFIVVVAMIRPRLTHWSAGWLVLAGGLAAVRCCS